MVITSDGLAPLFHDRVFQCSRQGFCSPVAELAVRRHAHFWLDGVDYATTWVELRAMWGRGQAGTLAALRDVEASLPFELLGLDSDNGGEFLNYLAQRIPLPGTTG